MMLIVTSFRMQFSEDMQLVKVLEQETLHWTTFTTGIFKQKLTVTGFYHVIQ